MGVLMLMRVRFACRCFFPCVARSAGAAPPVRSAPDAGPRGYGLADRWVRMTALPTRVSYSGHTSWFSTSPMLFCAITRRSTLIPCRPGTITLDPAAVLALLKRLRPIGTSRGERLPGKLGAQCTDLLQRAVGIKALAWSEVGVTCGRLGRSRDAVKARAAVSI